MTDILELAKQRTSVRNFSDRKIEKPVLDYLMEAVRLAPSAVNFQPWSFYIVEGKDRVVQLSEAYNRDWFRTAPLCLVACGNHEKSWHRSTDNKDHCDIDVSIAVTHWIMAATEKGLGTCWVCNFKPDVCAKLLNLPEHLEPIAIIPTGYPADASVFDNNEKKRKSIDEIFHY